MIREVVKFIEEKLQGMGFAYISVDCGQADLAQPAIKYPAALIDVEGIDVDNALGGRSLQQTMRVNVRIIEMVLANVSSKAPEPQKEAWYSFVDILETALAELHQQARFVPMAYTGMEIRQRDDGLREGVLHFSASMGTLAVDDSLQVVVAEEIKKGEKASA